MHLVFLSFFSFFLSTRCTAYLAYKFSIRIINFSYNFTLLQLHPRPSKSSSYSRSRSCTIPTNSRDETINIKCNCGYRLCTKPRAFGRMEKKNKRHFSKFPRYRNRSEIIANYSKRCAVHGRKGENSIIVFVEVIRARGEETRRQIKK